jgi:hypothetical protein
MRLLTRTHHTLTHTYTHTRTQWLARIRGAWSSSHGFLSAARGGARGRRLGAGTGRLDWQADLLRCPPPQLQGWVLAPLHFQQSRSRRPKINTTES